MGRINNRVKYPIDNIVTLDDSVIGSDFDQNGKTKNYSVRGIISLALSEGNTNISNGVLSGSVYWLQGLEFASTKIDYTFNNTLLQSESQSPIVLSPADLTNDRVDVFAIDAQTNKVVVVEGIPSANPQEPTVDFIYQIRLSSVTIPANASAPLNLETVQIYDENLGQPSEWDSTFVQNSGTINVNYPVDPSKGTKGIFFDNIPTDNLNSITFTNSDIVTPSNINFDFKTINFQGILYMSLLDNLGEQVSAPITILNNSFGIDFLSGTYNTVSIPITSFGTISGDIYGLRITALPFKEGYSFLIDNILFQKGINTPNQANDTFLGLTDTFNDYFNRGFEILRVNKSATGIESVRLQDILPNVALSGEYGDLLNTPQNTSNFTNDGSDGVNPFITSNDVDESKWEVTDGTINNVGIGNLVVPTEVEWNAERLSWGTNDAAGAFASPLKLTMSGYRDGGFGLLFGAGTVGYYWSSTVISSNSRNLEFTSPSARTSTGNRVFGNAVRLILNGSFTQQNFNDSYLGQIVVIEGLTYGYVYNSITSRIWLDKNLGATQVATSSTDASSYGDLYQWGRGTDGHQIRTSGTTTTLSTTDVPGNGNFILDPNPPYDWRSPQNDNLWQPVQKLIGKGGLKAFYGDLLNLPDLNSLAYLKSGDNTSELTNNGSDGVNPFITLNDVPERGELERIIEGTNTGYALLNDDRLYKGDIGNNAIDLTKAINGNTNGATGDYSISTGFNTTASGFTSYSQGGYTIASGNYSNAQGLYTTASGAYSHSQGINTFAKSEGEHAGGKYTTDYTPSNDSTDRLVNYGNGTNALNLSDAWTLYKNGAHKFFTATLASITNAVKGFVMLDQNARLNVHNGTQWNALAYVDEIPSLEITQVAIEADTTLDESTYRNEIFFTPLAPISIGIDHTTLLDKHETFFINESNFIVTFVPSLSASTNVIAEGGLILGGRRTAYLSRKGNENKIYLNISN